MPAGWAVRVVRDTDGRIEPVEPIVASDDELIELVRRGMLDPQLAAVLTADNNTTTDPGDAELAQLREVVAGFRKLLGA